MLIDDTPRSLPALREIPGVEVATKWPKDAEKGPVVLVTLAGDRPVDQRDDREYLTELEYYVRIFTARADEMRRVCGRVHEVMEGLGYMKTFRWEEQAQDMRQTILRYKTTT